ncbi:hypothetical protein [Photobacterium leiognathi]|uniref:hypothetical protein n=1 Tax=Photobacterium leiognathi TaxID=553611 RepID=UPI0029825625|nr:hypothetical protein [Photobacterium leiognathi]
MKKLINGITVMFGNKEPKTAEVAQQRLKSILSSNSNSNGIYERYKAHMSKAFAEFIKEENLNLSEAEVEFIDFEYGVNIKTSISR